MKFASLLIVTPDSFPPGLMSFNSAFYNSYLQRHDNEYTVTFCANCSYSHTSTRFCLPYLHSPYELDFLLDFLQYTPQNSISPSLFHSLIRLCDYLLLNPAVIIDMIYLYIPQNFANRSYLEALVDILNATSYRELGLELPQIISPFFEVLRSPSVFT